MNTISIEGQVRSDLGKKATTLLRRENHVPCVVYGGKENIHFSAPVKSFSKLVYSPNFYMVDIDVDGTTHKTILKDLQFHPVTDQILHMDFVELSDDKKIIVDLPIVFEGLAPGVKEGGKLMPKLRKLRVKALPSDLIDVLKVDITELVLGKSIKVGDLSYDNIEIQNPSGIPICSVEIPRALKSAEDEAAEAEATAGEGEAGEGEEAAATEE